MADVLPENVINPASANDPNEPSIVNNSANNSNEPSPDEVPTAGNNRPPSPPNPQNVHGANANNPIRIEQHRRVNGQRAHLAHVSERIIYSLFVRFTFAYGRGTSAAFRRMLEFTLLFMALILFFLLVYMHTAFSHTPARCLEHIKDTWPRDGILRVEVIKNHDPNYTLEHSYLKEELMHQKHVEYLGGLASDLDLFFGSAEPVAAVHQKNDTESQKSGDTIQIIEENWLTNDSLKIGRNETLDDAMSEDSEEKLLEDKAAIERKEKFEKITLAAMSEEYIVEYSLEYGFLRLYPATRKRLNISVQLVVLDPVTNDCFGDFLSKLIFDEILGYDDILMLSVKHLAEAEENKGFLRNVVTGEHYKFVNMWMGNSNYMAAAIVMMIFTLSVSMLLRYSHHQIFMFIVDLLQMLELNNTMTFPAAEMLTVILALVGMEAIMSEYFKDTSTAFYIIVLVWFCDQYDAICCHTVITKRHWLRFFYLYHFAFYSYHYRFNGQYSWLALMTSVTFILHSMIYFFHHYELPSLLQAVRMGNAGHIRTLNIVLHNVPVPMGQNAAAPAEQDAAQPAWPGGPPGVVLRTPEQIREGTRLVNIVVQNMAPPAIVRNQNGRRLFLQVLFQNLRNRLRIIHNGGGPPATVAPPATAAPAEVSPQEEPAQPTQAVDTLARGYGVENLSVPNDLSANADTSQSAANDLVSPPNVLTQSGTDAAKSSDFNCTETSHSSPSSADAASNEIRQRHRVNDQVKEEGSRESSDLNLD